MSLDYNNMANAMEVALEELYGENLPSAGLKDRKLLFKAIARGMLNYLESQQDEMFNSITLRLDGGTERTFDVTHLDLNTKAGT